MTLALSIDVLFLAIAVTTMATLGVIVFFKSKGATGSLFLIFTAISAVWSILNYATYQPASPHIALWLIRLVLFFAVFQALSFYMLIYVFPKTTFVFPNWIIRLVTPLIAIVSILTLSPLVFSDVKIIPGGVPQPTPGPGIVFFAVTSVSFVVAGIFLLIRKALRATHKTERAQLTYLLIGVAAMFLFIILFNFIFPVFFKNTNLIPFSTIFVLPFVIATTYSILRHQLFNIRVITTEIFAAGISIFFLTNVLLSNTLQTFLVNGATFLLVASFGIMLIRGTLREIRELERLSRAKSEFVSIASHQLRAPLTAIKGFMSMIEEGSGTEENRKDWLKKIGISNERLVRLVDDLLNISRIERGTLQYNFEESDFVQLIDDVIADFQFQAKTKNLSLAWEKPSEDMPKLRIDSDKMIQVITNLIDNALKYTEKGSVVVRLLYLPDLARIRLIVQDTGIGIPKEDIPNIFELFSRGEGAQKTSSEGVGIGLYVARKVVEAHKGKIWAESEGLHKGSRFYVELPIR